MDTNTSSIYLPIEVIEVILSKCPIKSVVRFKSVSKSWQSIISGPRFSRLRRIDRQENQNKFFYLWRALWGERRGLHVMRLEDEKLRTISESVVGYPSRSSRTFFEPLCSCDGLFLLHADDKDYILWNPFIGKHVIIPTFNQPRWSHLYHDSITDDYKIVFLYSRFYMVYSCNNGTCEIKDYPCNWNPHWIECSAIVDGCLYVRYSDGEIMYFDARDGIIMHKLGQPEGVKRLYIVELEAVSGRLCLYGFADNDEQRLQLWVMEENGSFQKRWRKLISMEESLRAVCLNNEDDVILSSYDPESGNKSKHYLLCNPRSNCSFKEIDFHLDSFTDLFPYAENLYVPSPKYMLVFP